MEYIHIACNKGGGAVRHMAASSVAKSLSSPLLRGLPALCSSVSSPRNGRVRSTGSSVGDTATYTCNTGFELIGQAVTTCTLGREGGREGRREGGEEGRRGGGREGRREGGEEGGRRGGRGGRREGDVL